MPRPGRGTGRGTKGQKQGRKPAQMHQRPPHCALGDTFKGFVINSHDVTIVGQGVSKTKVIGAIKSYQATNLIIQDLTMTASVNGSALWIEGSDIRVERVEIMGSSLDGVTIQEGP